MKKCSYLVFVVLLLNGCATYTKSFQLSPQKASGWKKHGPRMYQYECGQGEVEVGSIVLSYESTGDFNFFIPMPDSKEKVRKANENGAWMYLQFRDAKPIDSCALSYVSLVEQNSGKQIMPTRSMDVSINGTYEGKYAHICHYYFDLDKDLEGDYKLYISEKVFNCSVAPIPYKKERVFQFNPTELM